MKLSTRLHQVQQWYRWWRTWRRLRASRVVFQWLVLLVILTVMVTQTYWRSDFPYTHDGQNHLARFANYELAVREGQVPPRWAPNLMNRYGYPVFNYNYPLANILSLPLSFLGVPYELSFKLQVVLAVGWGISSVMVWLFFVTKHKLASWLGAISYATNPYLVNVLVIRGNIGELWAWSLWPTLLALVELHAQEQTLLNQHSKQRWWVVVRSLGIYGMTGAVWVAALLAHNIMALLIVPSVTMYAAWRLGRNWRKQLCWFLTMAWAMAASLWFWLPAVAEKSMVVLDGASLSKMYQQHFPTLSQLLSSPLRFGFSFPGDVDSLSFAIGAPAIVMLWVVLGWAALWRRRGEQLPWSLRHWSWLMVGVLLLAIIFQLSLSAPIWSVIPMIRFIQFPWRLGIVVSLATAALIAGWWETMPKIARRMVVLAVGLQLLWATQLHPVGYFHFADEEYRSFSQSTSTANENLPPTFTYLLLGDWAPTPHILHGAAEATVQEWRGSLRHYILSVSEPSTVVEQTMVYPGWETTLTSPDGQVVRAEYVNSDEIAGRLAYQVQPGMYRVTSQFTQHTWARQWGNTISGLALALVPMIALAGGWWFFHQRMNRVD